MEKSLRAAATPNRQRSLGGAKKAPIVAKTMTAAAAVSSSPQACKLPAEARGLQWPEAFCASPKGERLELLEGGTLARRTSGVGFGTALVGPLSLEKGAAYFEVLVTELEPKRSQTMAIGLCVTPPVGAKVARAERARDLGQGSYLLGYDLPKVYANGAEVAKIATKEWRPLKELAEGDIIGLLVERAGMELTVFVNGERKANAAVPPPDGSTTPSPSRWPGEVWGIFDLHGTVRAVRLRGPTAARQRPQLTREPATSMPPPAPSMPSAPPVPQRWTASSPAQASLGARRQPPGESTPAPAARLASTQEMEVETPLMKAPEGSPVAHSGTAASFVAHDAAGSVRTGSAANVSLQSPAPPEASSAGTVRRGASRACFEAGGPKKRMRLSCHPCGCMVHLLRESGEVVHVPRMGDFVIGRNPKSCNLTLDSPEVPNMVSRRHAVIVSADDAVMVVDCESVNGTYVNGRRVGRETLRQGDELVVGNPAQSPSAFKLSVQMPPNC